MIPLEFIALSLTYWHNVLLCFNSGFPIYVCIVLTVWNKMELLYTLLLQIPYSIQPKHPHIYKLCHLGLLLRWTMQTAWLCLVLLFWEFSHGMEMMVILIEEQPPGLSLVNLSQSELVANFNKLSGNSIRLVLLSR